MNELLVKKKVKVEPSELSDKLFKEMAAIEFQIKQEEFIIKDEYDVEEDAVDFESNRASSTNCTNELIVKKTVKIEPSELRDEINELFKETATIDFQIKQEELIIKDEYVAQEDAVDFEFNTASYMYCANDFTVKTEVNVAPSEFTNENN